MPDWFPFILGLVCAGLSGVLGTYVSLVPPASRTERHSYLAAFVLLFLGGLVAAIWQNAQENAATRQLAETIQRIDTQTKQPQSITVAMQSPTGPLPVYPLRNPTIPSCFNDPEWTTVTHRPIEIPWAQMNGIDAFADLDVYSESGDCGGTAQARIFDVVAGRAVVTGQPTKQCGWPYERQQLKLPREETHAYVLQTIASYPSCAAARGDVHFARQ